MDIHQERGASCSDQPRSAAMVLTGLDPVGPLVTSHRHREMIKDLQINIYLCSREAPNFRTSSVDVWASPPTSEVAQRRVEDVFGGVR